MLCRGLSLFTESLVAIDGSKFKAVNNRDKNFTRAKLKLVEALPGEATWSDLMYEIYVRQQIEEGIKAVDEGRVLSHEGVRQRFGV